MKQKLLFIVIFISGAVPLLSQIASRFPKSLQQEIFEAYQLKFSEFYGIFDSTESFFLVHVDSMRQSRFDSSCLLGNGKAWHRGQRTDFTSYITIDTIVQIEKTTDSALMDKDYWGLQLPYLKTKGNTLWKCEGEFSMNEDATQKFSGRFQGTFCIYFIYTPASNKIIALPEKDGFGMEPGFAFYGFWKAYGKSGKAGIAFFFANTSPQVREDNSSKIPDLRFQPDGNQSFSNIVILSPEAMKPAVNWFQ